MSLPIAIMITWHYDIIAPDVFKQRIFDLAAEFNFFHSDFVGNNNFILR
jgi:hypothetical protein